MRRILDPNPSPERLTPFREFLANLRTVLGLERRRPLPLTSSPSSTAYADLGRSVLPVRGMLYSSLVHEIAILAILFLPFALPSTDDVRNRPVERQWVMTRLTDFLPAIGGGHEGGGRPGGKSGGGSPKRPGRPSAPPSGSKGGSGLVYPAAQAAVSSPPNPTNRIQTILQPDLVKPPELKVPLPLPNMVSVGRGPRLPTPPPLAPKVKLEPTPLPRTTEAPKLEKALLARNVPYTLPETPAPPPLPEPKLELPPSLEAAPPAPRVDPSQFAARAPEVPLARAEAPEAPDLPPALSVGGTDARSILVLSPTPGPPTEAPIIPSGEARGEFAMGPEGSLMASIDAPGAGIGTGTGPGSETGSAGAGSGSDRGGTGAGGPPGIGPGGEGGGTGTGSGTGVGSGRGSGVGTGEGTGTGSGVGPGTGISGTGSGTGAGSGSGSGRGFGEGTGSGTGSGAGSGPGSGPFPGISIMGGTGSSGIATGAKSGSAGPPGPRPTYGMSITSTAASGGGLRDYGIFRNESVFTVYVEMTHSPNPAPSWILQYALLRRPAPDVPASSGTVTHAVRMGEQVTAPFPLTKVSPEFPRDVVARNLGRLAVVYGEINTEGKIENTRIIQSPNPLLNQPLLEALAKWLFRPAELEGKPVAVKVLLGIPVSLPR